jgi:hypothetical protein
VVPHAAIGTAMTKNAISSMVRPSSISFAESGPMIQRAKVVNAPRMAIIELKSGMNIDTVTAMNTKDERSMMNSIRFPNRVLSDLVEAA